MVFRLLYTLEKCGIVDKLGQNLYQSRVRPWKQRLYRLGYAAQGTDYQFSNDGNLGPDKPQWNNVLPERASVVSSLKNKVMPVNEGLTPSEELPSNAGEGPVGGEVREYAVAAPEFHAAISSWMMLQTAVSEESELLSRVLRCPVRH
jgi:hypothetical protein